MKKITQKIALSILLALSITSCKKENNNYSQTFIESGSAIVVNEGNFGSSNASISYIDRDGVASNYIYEAANSGINIGDIIQSYTTVGTKGIICVNNSNKIEIVDARTFKHIATIIDNTASQNTSYVRYAIGVSNTKAYVTNGNSATGDVGEVEVIDLNTNTITKSINVGKGPEQLAIFGNSVYVCNSGGYNVDSTVSVINIANDVVTATINVGDIPTKIVKDAQNNLWVLCKGQAPDYITNTTPAKLVRINTTTNTVDRSFVLINAGSPTIYNMNLAIGDNGRKVYYSLADNVYVLDITTPAISTMPLISKDNLYGLSASPYNNQIWVLQAPNFTSSGYVFRYNATGSLIDSIKVGIAPNGAFFNP